MVTAGDVCKPHTVRVPGVKRPVPVYARSMRQADAAQGGASVGVDLIMAWAGLAGPAVAAVEQPMEAAM
jgi:hypothetical protein